jgi:hypothetical protein
MKTITTTNLMVYYILSYNLNHLFAFNSIEKFPIHSKFRHINSYLKYFDKSDSKKIIKKVIHFEFRQLFISKPKIDFQEHLFCLG